MNNKNAFLLAGAVALTDSAIKGYLTDVPVRNYGFAGNRMDKYPKAVAYVSAALTGVMVIALAAAPQRMKLPMALILGGALSNSADRLIRGYVVDYIPMGKKYYGNISDFAIFLGSGIGTVKYLLEDSDKEKDVLPLDDIVSA